MAKEDYEDFSDIVEPLFSIHIPGDYHAVTYLIDEFDDNIKISKFCEDKIKQNQIDNKRNEENYKRLKNKAYIPFTEQLIADDNTRRLVEKDLYVKNEWEKTTYCELNYTINMSKQILKVVREKSE